MTGTAQTIVITGASNGFKEDAVLAIAEREYRVWGTMRDIAGRNATKKAAPEAHSPKIPIVEMDVTSDASVVRAFAEIHARGPVGILISNAGIMYTGVTEADRAALKVC